MRIVLATSSYAPYVGGVEEHVRNVAERMTALGHDVTVWTVARDGRARRRVVHGVEVRDLPAPLPSRTWRGIAGFAWRGPTALLWWWRAFRIARPDVVHVQCFGPNGTYAYALSRLGRRPLVVTSHGETLGDDDGVFDRSVLARTSLRRALQHAAAVTGVSDVVLRDLRARFGLAEDRGTVVPNGVDLDEPAGTTPEGVTGRYVAAVGRVQRVKGFDLLVAAFALAGLPADVSLVIGGDGPEAVALADQARRAGVGDRVRVTGWLDRAAVGALLREAAVGVVPSRFEAFGIAALEVWRAETPLIATTRGGTVEFVHDGVDGLLVDPEDVDALAGALGSLLDDPDQAARLAAAGRARVHDFTWDRVAEGYEEIYGRCVGAAAAERGGPDD